MCPQKKSTPTYLGWDFRISLFSIRPKYKGQNLQRWPITNEIRKYPHSHEKEPLTIGEKQFKMSLYYFKDKFQKICKRSSESTSLTVIIEGSIIRLTITSIKKREEKMNLKKIFEEILHEILKFYELSIYLPVSSFMHHSSLK